MLSLCVIVSDSKDELVLVAGRNVLMALIFVQPKVE